jgi:hypothetical protein
MHAARISDAEAHEFIKRIETMKGGLSLFNLPKWTTYSTTNGLASNNVQCIAVADRGVYVGTDAGLSVSAHGGA